MRRFLGELGHPEYVGQLHHNAVAFDKMSDSWVKPVHDQHAYLHVYARDSQVESLLYFVSFVNLHIVNTPPGADV